MTSPADLLRYRDERICCAGGKAACCEPDPGVIAGLTCGILGGRTILVAPKLAY
jgi:hypothetical protein